VQARLSQQLEDVRLMSETDRSLLEKAESKGRGELDNYSIIEGLRRTGTSPR